MNIEELQHVLGMVTHMAPFTPSEQTANLRCLLKKDRVFVRTKKNEVFGQINALISQKTTTVYFDPTRPTVILVDASKRGLRFTLVINGKAVAFTSKFLILVYKYRPRDASCSIWMQKISH